MKKVVNVPKGGGDKEDAAMLKRQAALQHLETQGQKVSVGGKMMGCLIEKPVDNTLQLVMRQNALQSIEQSKRAENDAKRAIVQQQAQFRSDQQSKEESKPLPKDWQEVEDPSNHKVYYWNTVTNETTWTRPVESEDSSFANTNDLPPGWEERKHPATGQLYYLHTSTGQTIHSKPSSSSSITQREDSKTATTSTKVGVVSTPATSLPSSNDNTKKRKIVEVDPLDPSGGQRGPGRALDGKMADSTASGPLWQQRPYPAPSQVLKQRQQRLIKKCLSTALISLQLSGDLSESHQLASAYDNYAAHYDKLDDSLISKRLGIDNLRDDLASYVHGDVLEVAMGTGIQLQHYDWSHIHSFAGIDLSEGMLSIAREKIEKMHVPASTTLQQMNVEQMTWRDKQFDTVVDTFSFCVFPHPEKALEEMIRVTKPGGRVVLLENTRSVQPILGLVQDLTAPLTTPLAKGCRANVNVPAIANMFSSQLELDHNEALLQGSVALFVYKRIP
eukprot:gene573-618_t